MWQNDAYGSVDDEDTKNNLRSEIMCKPPIFQNKRHADRLGLRTSRRAVQERYRLSEWKCNVSRNSVDADLSFARVNFSSYRDPCLSATSYVAFDGYCSALVALGTLDGAGAYTESTFLSSACADGAIAGTAVTGARTAFVPTTIATAILTSAGTAAPAAAVTGAAPPTATACTAATVHFEIEFLGLCVQ